MYSKTIVVGRAGRDAEIKYLPDGTAVASLGVAESRGKDKTIWWNCSFWRQQAESAAEHIKKGDAIVVEGVAEASAYTGSDGSPRADLKLTVHSWRFAGGGRNGDAGEAETADTPF
jgi:single-strand DNA-binding protein